MRQRHLTRKPTIETATNEELFTELLIRLRKMDRDEANVYFIDRVTCEPYPTWSVYTAYNDSKPLIKEIKQ